MSAFSSKHGCLLLSVWKEGLNHVPLVFCSSAVCLIYLGPGMLLNQHSCVHRLLSNRGRVTSHSIRWLMIADEWGYCFLRSLLSVHHKCLLIALSSEASSMEESHGRIWNPGQLRHERDNLQTLCYIWVVLEEGMRGKFVFKQPGKTLQP